MTDEVGLFEHADGAIPRREHGYCVDDVARGLMVLCREPFPSEAAIELSGRYLTFLAHAQGPDGSFHNRLGYDRSWHDRPATGDWWGRALWGLGTAAAGSSAPWIRDAALGFFERGAHHRPIHLRAMAFAALGAAQVLTFEPTHRLARALLADAALAIGTARTDQPVRDEDWPWPQTRLAYGNATLPEVLLMAGHLLGDEEALARGLAMLGWLMDVESNDGHFSPTPVGGRGTAERQPGFDQQPIELAALADACATAFAITAEPRWAAGVRLAAAWFAGDNDAGTVMYDPVTGGGYDGLTAVGRNANQGAESTLALLSTLQQDRRLRTENP
ncbi:glycosyltransferase [Actinospica durhamensis]|uniref:Glycosyltransferase n=2 Tax=Actinospica durhamensis TaxID=1508375 RepID=A0A941EUV5_9ACTN|nr:glycosyltransferase [Actinospica durhamensis]